MKYFCSLAFSLLAVLMVNAQSVQDYYKINAKAAAKNMGIALVKKDYKNFIKTTYPKAIEGKEGGTDAMLKDIIGQVNTMEQEGTTIIAVWPGEPSKCIDTAGEIQCTIPQKMTMKMPEGKLTTETTLIALSPDKGKTWYFMDSADRSINKMREMFPNISSRLVIPKSPEPVFVEDKKAK